MTRPHGCRPARASTIRPSSTTPAVSASSPTSAARSSHDIVEQGIQVLDEPRAPRRLRLRPRHRRRRRHPDPDARRVPAARGRGGSGIELPDAGRYAVGDGLPARRMRAQRAQQVEIVERIVDAEGQRLLGWREVPARSRRDRPARAREHAARSARSSSARRTRARRSRRLRAQALRDPPPGRERRCARELGAELLLRAEPLVAARSSTRAC